MYFEDIVPGPTETDLCTKPEPIIFPGKNNMMLFTIKQQRIEKPMIYMLESSDIDIGRSTIF